MKDDTRPRRNIEANRLTSLDRPSLTFRQVIRHEIGFRLKIFVVSLVGTQNITLMQCLLRVATGVQGESMYARGTAVRAVTIDVNAPNARR
jgi:hypothetical protein